MISFENDYNAGAHPKILARLVETNMEKLTGYGNDHYCQQAAEKIKMACEKPDAEVHFLVGGTQTNAVVIAGILQRYQGVVAVETGHIGVHEAGAIEYTGHKVLTLPEHEGKMEAKELATYLKGFYEDETHTHMVFPGMVYLSHPTELGTLYTKAELEAIADICQTYELPLFLDGARLGYGLMSKETDVTMADIAQLCDVFYIGGTKVGALCGEAIVFTKNNTPKNFSTVIKQQGALLAKGRLLGIQFDTLFTDDLYLEVGHHAMEMAELLRGIFKEQGYELYIDSPTNQQFVVLENSKLAKLKETIAFSFWEKIDEEQTAVRFVTSWATTKEDIEGLRESLAAL
ncbi:MAG: threonine aldolase family protein [Enterococcus sp.]